ncbi:MAG: alpha/beta hydrolase-fold protein [Schleiferilactobacillus harbinensis]|nr:alpha/beta hydrolase-fold protein [Schleiferilactobacillus harbinensis]
MISTRSQIKSGTVYSPLLGIDWNYAVYLPVNYQLDTTTAYPVLYMLSGLYGNYRDFLTRMPSQAILDKEIQAAGPMIVIFVDGFNSFYINARHGMAMEDALICDLVPAMAERYRIQSGASHHAIGGIGMGGYGAARFILRYPDIFAKGLLISPTVWERLKNTSPLRQHLHAFNDGQEPWSDRVYTSHFPTHDVHHRMTGLSFYIETSATDHTIPVHDVRDFATVLREAEIPVDYVQDETGTHGWAYWQPAVARAYRWLLGQ